MVYESIAIQKNNTVIKISVQLHNFHVICSYCKWSRPQSAVA